MTHVPLDQVTFAKFKELAKTRFRVHLNPAASVELELIEAVFTGKTGAGGSNASGNESFSLVFRGPANQPLAQRIYLFEHDQIGAFDLFIVPIGAEQGSFRYEAVFNRRIPQR